MIKTLAILFLAILLAIPQFFFSSYVLIIGCWIGIGALYAMTGAKGKVFGRAFLAQLLVGLILYYAGAGANMSYLENMLAANGLADHSTYILMGAFVLFNCLNAAFCAMGGAAFVHFLMPPKVVV